MISREDQSHISTTSICHTLDPHPSVNSLGPTFCSQLVGLFNFAVSLVLDSKASLHYDLCPRNLGFKILFMDLTFGLKRGPTLEVWFLKLDGCWCSWIEH